MLLPLKEWLADTLFPLLSALRAMDPSTLESALNVTAPLCTLLQFLTGVPSCAKFLKRRATGEASALPFVAGALNCSVWLLYGMAVDQPAIQIINGAGQEWPKRFR